MKQLDDIKELSRIASSQWGMFTAAQASRIGITRLQLSRLSEKEQIERQAFGVYKMAGSPKGQFDDVRVAWLSVEPKKTVSERQKERENGIVVGGHTAAYLYGAGDLWPAPYYFISPSRKQTQREEILFRKRKLSNEDVALVEGIPATTPEYTVATLAAEGEDMSHIADIVFALQRNHIIDKGLLRKLLSPYAKKYGYGNHDGEAFLQYLFEGVSLARIWEASESFREGIEAVKSNPSFMMLKEQQEAINKIIKNLTPQSEFDQRKQIRDAIDAPALKVIREQQAAIHRIINNPAYQSVLAQQRQSKGIFDNSILETIQEQKKSIDAILSSSSYQTALARKGDD